jgi:type II secretory pathway pseudopilin PulG
MIMKSVRKIKAMIRNRPNSEGFSLVETLIAMIILTFGLMATGQMLASAIGGTTLARSKGSATMVAQDRLDFLSDAFRQDPNGADLTIGTHGPVQEDVINPSDSSIVNRYNVAWAVTAIVDPRPGFLNKAKQVTVTVTPIGSGTTVNNQVLLNKVINITAVFTPRGM